MGLFKSAKRAVKKITKPVAKVLDKVVPNEIKPYLPYLAAVAPVLGPMGAFGAKVANLSKLGALGTYGLGSLASQLAQEGSEGDFDVLPVLSAGLTGYLAAPGTTGMTTAQALDPAMGSAAQADVLANRSFLTQAKDLGITGVQGIEKFVQAPQTAKGFFGTTKAITTAASPAVTGQIGQDAYNFAKQAEADYLAELDAFNALAGEQREASDEARRSHITASMLRANFAQDVIDETLDQLGLLLKDGGIASFKDGGIMNLGGKEMDMRTGGFIPIGAKERADDVPARLSKNEFVMTADAVRAAGGGSVNKGAKRMYDLMHNLEARA